MPKKIRQCFPRAIFLCLFQMKANVSPTANAHLSVGWVYAGAHALLRYRASALLATTRLIRTGRSTFVDVNQAVLCSASRSCLCLLQEPTDSLEDSLLSSRPEFILGPEGEEEENPAAKHGENPGNRTVPSEHAGR